MTKLAFGDVVSESFRLFFGRLPLFFQLVTVPWIMNIVIWFAFIVMSDGATVYLVVQKLLETIPTVMFLTAWVRVILLGPQRVEGVPGLVWTARESATLAHLIKVAGVPFALVAAMMLFVGTIDPREFGKLTPEELLRLQSYLMPLSIGALVTFVLTLRVSFGIAATTVDVPFSPRLSWLYSKGNGGTVIGAMLVIYIVGNLVTVVALMIAGGVVQGLVGKGMGALLVTWTATSLVSFGALGVLATAQAVIFRSLLVWREGRALPPTS